ncbi:MAG: DUF2147 domain-containing protein [Ferruginibacter sp.]
MKSFIVLLALLSPFIVFAAKADDILGIWLTDNDESKIEIYKAGNEYFGKIIWLKEPNDKSGNPKKDVNNPDKTKRNNPAIGILVLKNVRYKNGAWEGIIYGPKRGKEVACSLKLINKDVLEGFVSYGFLSGSRTLRRVK